MKRLVHVNTCMCFRGELAVGLGHAYACIELLWMLCSGSPGWSLQGLPARLLFSLSYLRPLECASHWALLCVPLKTEEAEPLSICFPDAWVSSLVGHLSVSARFSVLAIRDSPPCCCVSSHSFSGTCHIFTEDDDWKCRPLPNQFPQKLWALQVSCQETERAPGCRSTFQPGGTIATVCAGLALVDTACSIPHALQ